MQRLHYRANIYEHGPTLSYNVDTVRAINESKRCLDAPTLSKLAVLELFSLGEFEGRNCLGRSATASEEKQPLDQIKLQFIQEADFAIYRQHSDGARCDVWAKCIEKINSQLRYLFRNSWKKYSWLDVRLRFH